MCIKLKWFIIPMHELSTCEFRATYTKMQISPLDVWMKPIPWKRMGIIVQMSSLFWVMYYFSC